MKRKNKIILATCALGLVLAALVTVIVVCQPREEDTDGEGAAAWQQTPVAYEQTLPQYDSYRAAFRAALSDLREQLAAANGNGLDPRVGSADYCTETGSELTVVSAYLSADDTTSPEATATFIAVYDNPAGGQNVMLCQFKNNTLHQTYILGEAGILGADCAVLLTQDCGVVVYRSGLGTAVISQSIYEPVGSGQYAVHSETCDAVDAADAALAAYLEDDGDFTVTLYTEVAVSADAVEALLCEGGE